MRHSPACDQSDIINENTIAKHLPFNDYFSKYKANEAKKKEKSGIPPNPCLTPPLNPQSFLGGDKVFQRQGTKHNFKDVSEGKDGKVLLILCNPIGL